MEVMRIFTGLLLCFALLLVSCSGNEEEAMDMGAQLQDQTWTLVRMSGSFEGSEREGEAMEWQEDYRFFVDGRFEKTRISKGDTQRAMGTFEAVEFDNDAHDYLQLTFTSGRALVGSCSGNDQELLRYSSATSLVSLWQACDGPELEYVLQGN